MVDAGASKLVLEEAWPLYPGIRISLVDFAEEALQKRKYKSIQSKKKNTVASLTGIWHVSLEIN